MFDIDFVIPWVDGADIEWQKQFNLYLPEGKAGIDIGTNRYRDNGLLRYWFRGVETFAPWVRKIHFITAGHKPEWLNINNPKLHFVKHTDYIPKEYLPTFNSSVIELMLHKIPDLSEHFVHFNDDFFLINPVNPENYFTSDGKVKDSAIFRSIPISEYGRILLSDEIMIDKCIDRKDLFRKNKSKWFSLKYKRRILQNLYFSKRIEDAYLECCHFSRPLTKTSISNGWEICEKELFNAMKNRYRTGYDLTICFFRILNLYRGNFEPINNEENRILTDIDKDINKICNSIKGKTVREIVINDSICENYDNRLKQVKAAFEYKFPKKSSFEL
ncbi:MAG: Stealth CR1 domain-containing protein [Treponema sp.]|nr:Stealth CR1 domain-containing protein [Treponema sp.]